MTHASQSSPLDPRRKRLRYQCWHRGIREMDMILGHFADTHLADLPEEQLADLEVLLTVPDQALYRWVCGSEPVPERYQTPVWDLVADVSDLRSLWHDEAEKRP